MIDINLLSSKDVLTAGQKLWKNRLFWATVILTTGTVLSLAIVLGVDWWSTKTYLALKNQKQELLTEFSKDLPKLEMLLSLKDKLAGIKHVQAVRPNLSLAITTQQGMQKDGVSTSRLVVNSGGEMSFDVAVKDYKVLSSYISDLESDNSRSFFSRLRVSSLQMGKDGRFVFSVEASFDKSKLLTSGKNQ